ncbi:hypothetical protein PULV_a3449 [Pseudoalteromonas ulvae UL12]|uniref:QueD like 2 n=1 Tax=Pseudoalteromonas ulvae TaxID=107327 RepID=A0A244CTF3_PSEDV|nr:VC2046/SO_2500 family protein [Pseudoalteromonas ulvae]MBE0363274.1 hypothetical protein [Pseudoalteromonas ulvae UL12]OUL58883.1 hypothetical protein B1199_00940 [Pseudoalteromonas ulvae]
MQIDGILTNEAQLGNQLAISVDENRRSDFSLLLAMLSHDAVDFAQFHLPHEEQPNPYAEISDSTDLRIKLGAGPAQPLAIKPIDFLIGQENAALLQSDGMKQIKLKQYLKPEPLALRDDNLHISSEIINNCELNVKKRYLKQDTQMGEMQINAAAFYDNLQNPALHKPLSVITA